jgi:hypothetical protein
MVGTRRLANRRGSLARLAWLELRGADAAHLTAMPHAG